MDGIVSLFECLVIPMTKTETIGKEESHSAKVKLHLLHHVTFNYIIPKIHTNMVHMVLCI